MRSTIGSSILVLAPYQKAHLQVWWESSDGSLQYVFLRQEIIPAMQMQNQHFPVHDRADSCYQDAAFRMCPSVFDRLPILFLNHSQNLQRAKHTSASRKL